MPIPLKNLLDAILTGDTSEIVLKFKTVGLADLKRALNTEPKSQTRQDKRRATILRRELWVMMRSAEAKSNTM
jgi:hypothetical protein